MSRMAPAEELERRLLLELGDRARLGGFAYPLLMAFVGWQSPIPADHPLLYWSGLAFLTVSSLWRWNCSRKALTAESNWRVVREELRVSTLLLVSGWSVWISMALWEYANRNFVICLVFALIAWASIGANVFAPDRHLSHVFIHLNMIPALVWSFATRERFGSFAALVFGITWFSLIRLVNRTHHHLRSQAETQILLETQAEVLLAAKVQAEEASRIRTQFLANVSHEIRTPLNGILGVSDILADSNLDEEQRDLVSIMSQSGRHLLTLVNELLDLSRINSGKLVLDHVEFDIRRVAHEVSRPMQMEAEAKGLEWRLQIRKEVPELCTGDPVRMRQILANLMSNALKFTIHGGVSIELGMADGEHMRCVVEDTGIGIDSGKLSSIFEAFEQAERGTTRRFGGSGLGLAIAKTLVELMRGRIGVQSVPGQGSLFWFEVPVHVPTSETHS